MLIFTKIYFDLDGVLADFDKGVRELCGMTPMPQGHQPPGYDEQLWAAAKKVGHFYDKLDILSDGKKLFDTIYELFPEKCEILTGIPRPSRGIVTAADDKVRWVRRNISDSIPVHTVLRKDKPLYCLDNRCVLIDDYETNISEWEAVGGIGILFTNAEDVFRRMGFGG